MNKIPGMTASLADSINALIEEGIYGDLPSALEAAMYDQPTEAQKEFIKAWESGVNAAFKALSEDPDDDEADFAVNDIQPYVTPEGEIHSGDTNGGSQTCVWLGGYKWTKSAKKKLGGQALNVQRERSSGSNPVQRPENHIGRRCKPE